MEPQPDQQQQGSTSIVLPHIQPGSYATYDTLKTFIAGTLIPLTTGRNKPKWGKEEAKPAWWPEGVPYNNLSRDPRGGKSGD